MNFRHNTDVPWGFVGAAPPVMATFGDLGLDNDDHSIYPSPPSELEAPLVIDGQNEPFLMDLDAAEGTSSSDKMSVTSESTTSASSSQDDKENEIVISFSTTFYPGNSAISSQADTLLSSSDGVLFYVNSQLLAASGFELPVDSPSLQLEGPAMSHLGTLMNNPLLQDLPPKLPESSLNLSIIFHMIYNIPCNSFSPSLDAIADALAMMSRYHLKPATLVYQGSFMYLYLMKQFAPFVPLELYALAGCHCIEALAVDVSSHLLGLDLAKISDDIAMTMGASYLRRLFFMHQGRLERLKKVLLRPPGLHDGVLSEDCDSKMKASLKSKWALMVTTLVWDAKPDISPFAMQQHLRLETGATKCKQCQASWADRVTQASKDWAGVKYTI